MAEMLLKGRKTTSHPVMCASGYTYTVVYLVVQICGISYDSSRNLSEQGLCPRKTSTRKAYLTAANNTISLRVLDGFTKL